MDETQPLVSITEAARRMGVSRATAYRLVTRGDLPAVKVGAQLRIDPIELHSYIYGLEPVEQGSDEPLMVDALEKVIGQGEDWIRRAARFLPARVSASGVLRVDRGDVPLWQRAAASNWAADGPWPGSFGEAAR